MPFFPACTHQCPLERHADYTSPNNAKTAQLGANTDKETDPGPLFAKRTDVLAQDHYGNQSRGYFNGGVTRVHHGRVGSAGLCDLKILHPWRRMKKGVKILQ